MDYEAIGHLLSCLALATNASWSAVKGLAMSPPHFNSKALGLLLFQSGTAVLGYATANASCSDLATSLQIPDVQVLIAESVPAGTNLTFPTVPADCTRSQVTLVDICRVRMLLTTGPTSNVTLEHWLPADWNGRFLATGNGGTNGCVDFNAINYGTVQGFAAIGTNNGHDGFSGVPFLNNPGVIEDFVYRAVHSSASIGKQVIQTYYKQPACKSYYLGCSTGGRQGFKEAQSFPDDFDGIVAGAPAIAYNDLNYQSGSVFIATGPPGSPSFLSTAQWSAVVNASIAQCDLLDNVADGILEDPDLCQPRFEALLCAANQTNSTTCLTPTQVETARRIYSPIYGPQGQLIFPRIQPGVGSALVYGGPFSYSTDWWRYVVYNDTTWDPSTLGLDDWVAETAVNPFNIQTFLGDLSAVRDRGTKVLHYHGLQDGLISSENSRRYYENVQRAMGATYDELDDFYRYFRISGMGHCSGGSGASVIGNGKTNTWTDDADGNVLQAMVRWVEEGVAPETIEGAKFKTGGNGTEVEYTRRHCRWPRRNVWDGEGDVADPDSWNCE
ncbi:tannase and feruloyl esterase [Elsinoe ampelina]|uniref:Carboxylic ester hydrolase n=1 Tax=Elsinoe ampelina TaxID=302913 RepID=A0A6A6GMY7_9PEZI|nr:tannase and feruloyl esterase [Elsinoe ampelina]